MKKYLGVFELYVRTTVYKLFPVFIISAIAQAVLFKNKLGVMDWGGIPVGFEDHIDASCIMYVFAVTFVASCVILCLCGCEFSSKSSYTLKRLGVTEKGTMLCQAAYNSSVFALLLMLETILCIALFKIYSGYYADVEKQNFITQQTLFLAFYRNDFLCSLLPLEDYLKVVRNIVFVFGLGFVTAAFPFLQRRRKICFETVITVLAVILSFEKSYIGVEELVYAMIAVVILCGICFARTVIRKDVDNDEAKA